MKIYLSHPVSNYGTANEKILIEKIKELYLDAEIINPKYIVINDKDKEYLSGSYYHFIEMMEKYFFPEIKKCDLLLAVKIDSNKYTGGVRLELDYAKKINKEVVEWEI